MNALPPGHRAEPGHQARWLWRTLRAAELAGLDPARVLAEAIAERDLAGSRDVPAVIDARIRHRLGSVVPLPPGSWSAQVPAIADPDRRAYAEQIAGAREAGLAAARADADAAAAERSGYQQAAARHRVLAASYRAMGEAYRDRERVFARVMADRADWEAATRAQRHLAVAADAELRRRHPGQRFAPLRSAESPAVTAARRAELTLTAGPDLPDAGPWIRDLDAGHRRFAARLADRQSLTIPAEDPDYGDVGQAFPAWTGSSRDAILQPPKPQIRPSARVLERAADREADIEAGE
jgi:hypothetical protein